MYIVRKVARGGRKVWKNEDHYSLVNEVDDVV